MPLVGLLTPVETPLGIRPRDVQHEERRPPAEPEGSSVLLHMLDDRRIHAVRSVPVAVVMRST